jgi:hypothetical protein
VTEELFTGWAADAPVDDTLLRQFTFALADRGTFLAERTGRRELRTDAIAAVDLESPVIFDNAAVVLQPPTMCDLDAEVAAVCAHFPPERAFVIASPWHLGDLSHHGLQLMGYPPFMVRAEGGELPPVPSALDIEEVRDGAALDTFVDTLIEAYPIPGAQGSAFDERVLDGPIHLFIGREDGRPVATAGTYVGHGLNDVEWVSVMADCRGKGFGAAITGAATGADPRLPAALIASDDGFGIYTNMGYRSLLRFTLWYRSGTG